jgi:hypothetical protein
MAQEAQLMQRLGSIKTVFFSALREMAPGRHASKQGAGSQCRQRLGNPSL